jgi:hypothetical protein
VAPCSVRNGRERDEKLCGRAGGLALTQVGRRSASLIPLVGDWLGVGTSHEAGAEALRVDEVAQLAYDLGNAYEARFGACSLATLLAFMDTLGEKAPQEFRTVFGLARGRRFTTGSSGELKTSGIRGTSRSSSGSGPRR